MRLRLSAVMIVILGLLFSISVQASPGLNAWKDEIIYFIMVDRFYRGSDSTDDSHINQEDPLAFHGGNIRGIIEKLDYLDQLGVTAIWITPVFYNRPMEFFGHHSYHGYWIWDFFKIDPRFGTLEDLKQLSTELEKRDMRLLLDFVVNHAGYDAPIEKQLPKLFHPEKHIEDWNSRHQLESYRLYGLPDFASDKPVVQYFFRSVAQYWHEQIRPAGFRLDAVKHVQNSFWNSFNKEMRERFGEGFLTLGELLDGNPTLISSTLKDGSFSSLFDFPLYYTMLDVFARGGDFRALGVRLYEDRLYPEPRLMATFLDNHDLDRFITACGYDLDRYRAALVFLMTVRGIPTLTWGNETGLGGLMEPVPLNRTMMDFDANPELKGFVSRLTMLRRDNPALRRGLQTHLSMTQNSYAFARVDRDQAAFVLFNGSDQPMAFETPLPFRIDEGFSIRDELLGLKGVFKDDQLSCIVPPLKAAVFLVEGHQVDLENWHILLEERVADESAFGTRRYRFEISLPFQIEAGSLKLIGGIEQLGRWSPSAMLPEFKLSREGIYVLETDLPVGAVFECKTIIVSETGTQWQPGGNHILEVRPGETTETVRLEWSD